ncbi:MAG: arsenical pump-driving ATPase GET3 [Candidatus Omnitrophica bacterium]|jgi:thymidylate kinase|nr:arsenical pump-driving ATPase GET3 [Candidatus Omnitrophota bacterium]
MAKLKQEYDITITVSGKAGKGKTTISKAISVWLDLIGYKVVISKEMVPKVYPESVCISKIRERLKECPVTVLFQEKQSKR